MRTLIGPSKMIFRAPFSADLGQGGSTDLATEELTREAIENLDGFESRSGWRSSSTGRTAIRPRSSSRSMAAKLKDTYFKPSPKNYRVAWMIRNEDFYALRWGCRASSANNPA